jgi:hypothetical protein
MLNILLLALIKRDLQYIVRYPDSPALQRTYTENSKQIFPEKKLCGHSPNFHIHMSVSDLYIPELLPILLQEICGPILGIYKSFTDTRMCILGLRPRNSQKRNK